MRKRNATLRKKKRPIDRPNLTISFSTPKISPPYALLKAKALLVAVPRGMHSKKANAMTIEPKN